MANKKQQGNGSGTIYPRKNKGGKITSYQGSYFTSDGKRRYVSARTKTECREKLRQAMSDADQGFVFDAGSQTVGEYMTRWLEDFAKADLAPRTYHNYKLQLREHIVPAFGTMKLSKLDTPNIQSMYAAKLRGGLKPSSVKYIHAVLHRGLAKAVDLRLIPRNPAASANPPKARQEEIEPLGSDEARKFLEAARGEKFEPLYILCLTCGLRMGEALGLKWSDLDLEAGTLRVNRQLQRMREGGGLVFSEPKNASRRTIDLPQKTLEALRVHRKNQLEEKSGVRSYQDSGLVFATCKGTPLDAQNIVNRHFKPLLNLAGLPSLRWHDLRHTCATLLLGRGVHPKLVQHLLGHASISMTLDRYSHWIPSMGRYAADGMDEALG
ncbi:MAG: Phage integrase, site-specific tyrosine recombinase [uncultured Chloroflexia bacterium]|uniref:Phage integrase, site-specific tyrosine recombinase n=1 Tax=uncultured Chloroflexia bacterium TaxID=1672391 RepID=A0A6J4LQR5_9CHLR|nr:MAG: Phage integrase, site-specific tyrosine recombinase [uncultured Chloroflexia bacterium]